METNLNNAEMKINEESKAYLAETAKWARFISIVGFVMLGIAAIACLGILIFSSSMAMAMGGVMGAMGGAFWTAYAIVLLIALAIGFIPTLYQYNFATKAKAALEENGDEAAITESFEFLKKYYKFNGIVMIVVLGFYALGIIIGIIAGIAGAAMH